LKTKQFIFLLGILIVKLPVMAISSFGPTNVLLKLSKQKQDDTIGYNLVLELPKLLYPKIMDGSVILWDSPSKTTKISAEGLKELEKTNGIYFDFSENLFIEEVWTLSKRAIETKTLGFTFKGNTENGLITFGFIDYNDIFSLLQNTFIPSNANGFSNTGYIEAIKGKHFNYEILQFGQDNFTNDESRASELKNQLFNNPSIKKYNSPVGVAKYKSIGYEIEHNENENNDALFNSLTEYFKENIEQFMNLGGYQIISLLDKEPKINITKIIVWEEYKMQNGIISSEIKNIQMVVNGKKMLATDIKNIRKIEALVKSKPLDIFIQEKVYDLTVDFINDEEIKNQDGFEIIRKLNEGQWKNLLDN